MSSWAVFQPTDEAAAGEPIFDPGSEDDDPIGKKMTHELGGGYVYVGNATSIP